MKTYMAKEKDIKRKWYLIDASDKILGRLAVKVATILRGKHKPIYTPNVDTGDAVIVINASKIKVTGKKLSQKVYRRYSGYPGGYKEITLETMLAKNPCQVITLAVQRMLPGTPLGRDMIKKLKIYAGAEHPHKAQGPFEILK